MEVFISWSGERSKIFAHLFSDFLKRLLHPIKPWMSEEIPAGQNWMREIGTKLESTHIGLFCVTPENQNSSWLLFEAGALSKNLTKNMVCPILLFSKKSELTGPLSLFQAIELNVSEIYSLLLTLNNFLSDLKVPDEILKNEFKEKWPKFIKQFEKEINKVVFQSTSTVFSNILHSFKKSGLPDQELGQLIHFNEGFESHAFYEVILKSAKSRLYFFGRKNRKIFDKEYNWFFETLHDRIQRGLDFKCLFLDPSADESIIHSAHKDEDFRMQLTRSVNNAIQILTRHKISVSETIRKYNFQRAFSIAIVDDVVLFTPIEYSIGGRAEKLTRVSFSMTSSQTCQGKIMEHNFTNAWHSAIQI